VGFITGTYTIQFIVNGQTADTSKAFDTNTDFYQAISMEPSSVSPVLKTRVVITLDPAFPYVLAVEDFSVNATNVFWSTLNTEYKR
jgi:hypothetical protein